MGSTAVIYHALFNRFRYSETPERMDPVSTTAILKTVVQKWTPPYFIDSKLHPLQRRFVHRRKSHINARYRNSKPIDNLLTYQEEKDLLLSLLYMNDPESVSISKKALEIHYENQFIQENTRGND